MQGRGCVNNAHQEKLAAGRESRGLGEATT